MENNFDETQKASGPAPNFVNMDIDLDVELAADVAKLWVDKHTQPASQDVFDQIIFESNGEKVKNLDIETIERAVGATVLNQILLDALEAEMQRQKLKEENNAEEK